MNEMRDELSELRTYLDGLYGTIRDAAPRRVALVSAALNVIYAAARSDAELESAFRHLVAIDDEERGQRGSQDGVAPDAGAGKIYAPVINPQLHSALAREG